MNLIRSLFSLLILALVVISALGIVWWSAPPEPLAGYSTGGQLILAILIVTGLAGIWRLWAGRDRSHSH